METSTGDDVLNANRQKATPDEPTPAPAASTSRAAAPTVDARPQAFDWKKLWPWLLAAVVLLLVVWLLTRKGRPAPIVA